MRSVPLPTPTPIALTRGGGQTVQDLDHDDLISAVASSPVPVLVALGHATDDLVGGPRRGCIVSHADGAGGLAAANRRATAVPSVGGGGGEGAGRVDGVDLQPQRTPWHVACTKPPQEVHLISESASRGGKPKCH